MAITLTATRGKNSATPVSDNAPFSSYRLLAAAVHARIPIPRVPLRQAAVQPQLIGILDLVAVESERLPQHHRLAAAPFKLYQLLIDSVYTGPQRASFTSRPFPRKTPSRSSLKPKCAESITPDFAFQQFLAAVRPQQTCQKTRSPEFTAPPSFS
jgi:hypothetical protein